MATIAPPSAALVQLFRTPAGAEAVAAAPQAKGGKDGAQPRVIEDKVDLSAAARSRLAAAEKPKWPGAAPEGSVFYGQRNADGLWLDANGHAVVLEGDGRTVLIKSENGRKIQDWGNILNNASGQYSDVEKAKAYKQLVNAWQDGNPNFTFDEKRAAAGIANNSDFITKVSALNERINDIVKSGGRENSLITWYDNEAADWEKEMFAGEREKWEAIGRIMDGIEARVRAGAFKYGDQNPADGETRWLMSLFNRTGEVSSRPWEHPDMRAAMGGIRDELRAGYKASDANSD